MKTTTVWIGPLLLLVALTSPAWGDNPLGMTLTRQAPTEYTPGSSMEIQLTVAVTTTGEIRAMGLLEAVPEGWTFVSARAITGALPSITPSAGDTGTLAFAWIIPPALPCSFAYTVNIPADSHGQKSLSGHVDYRLEGPELSTDEAVTEIQEAGAEGEGEGEGEPDVHEIAGQLLDGFADGDTDHDGSLSLAEAQALIPTLTQQTFDLIDTNSDGKLSQAEAEGRRKPGHLRVQLPEEWTEVLRYARLSG